MKLNAGNTKSERVEKEFCTLEEGSLFSIQPTVLMTDFLTLNNFLKRGYGLCCAVQKHTTGNNLPEELRLFANFGPGGGERDGPA
jgi:hypothetical protein